MKLPRRYFLHLAAGAAALPVLSRPALARDYPTRPVRLIVPLFAGSTTDIVARLLGQSLSERLGQPFAVDNRVGASGNIATEAVVLAPPDGYTLLILGPFNAINATLYDKLNFDFIRDIAPIASIDRSPLVMAVNPSIPAKTVAEFIAYAKANPGKINLASGSNGTVTYMAAELFKLMAGIDVVHVLYRGSYLPDLLSGQVQGVFSPIPTSIENIRAGRLRALAVTTATRSQALPDIPTVGEFVPGYEVIVWDGVGAPRNTPAEVIDELNKEINAALADPKMTTRFADLGAAVVTGSPTDLAKLIAGETEKWGKVIREAHITAE
jgi:tripartite-type tricarboxylate transporter receptor subunit TctC